MRYGNAIVREYPDFVKVSVFNFNIVDETKPCIKRIIEKTEFEKHNEVVRISQLRAKQKIFDISLLNKFDYFVTFTFNDKIQDAHDYEQSINKVKRWCQNQVKRYGLRYLLVPELHPSSGRIHLHGLLVFDTTPSLQFSGHFDTQGRDIYNLPLWSYGFSTIIQLDDNPQNKLASYITKYITKDLEKITGNYYYAGGHGLIREPEITYVNIPYKEFEGYETKFRDSMCVKHSVLTKEQALYVMFERVDSFD